MTKGIGNRRQKDISRVLRERKDLQRDKLAGQKRQSLNINQNKRNG
jgi:hypothetical protein